MISKENKVKKVVTKKTTKKLSTEDQRVIIDKCYLIKDLMASTRIDSKNISTTTWISTFSNEDCDKLKVILQSFIEDLKCS